MKQAAKLNGRIRVLLGKSARSVSLHALLMLVMACAPSKQPPLMMNTPASPDAGRIARDLRVLGGLHCDGAWRAIGPTDSLTVVIRSRVAGLGGSDASRLLIYLMHERQQSAAGPRLFEREAYVGYHAVDHVLQIQRIDCGLGFDEP